MPLDKAVLNFEKSISLNYGIAASKGMIESAKRISIL